MRRPRLTRDLGAHARDAATASTFAGPGYWSMLRSYPRPMANQSVPLSFDLSSIPWEPAAPDGTRAATLVGTRDAGVQFTYAFFIPPQVFDAPHSHIADAHLIAASGELLLGYGDAFDRSHLTRYGAGSFLWVPAGAVHYDGAEVETVLIGTAVGPWSTDYRA